MLAKTALLVVSNPKQIGTILPVIQKRVENTLYIQLLTALGNNFGGFCNQASTCWPKFSDTICGIYTQAAKHCYNLDVRVLLSGLKKKNFAQIQTRSSIDLVIFDHNYTKTDIELLINNIGNIGKTYDVLTLPSNKLPMQSAEDEKTTEHVVLGGTFDRLHIAHKVLLSEAVFRSEKIVTVGVTEETMLPGKTLWELIEDIQVRIENVKNFLVDICPELSYNIVPISDPFGPSIVDPTMTMIVVSEETIKGAQKVNEIRSAKNIPILDIIPVGLIEEPFRNEIEENKISSSTGRIRLLGTLLKPVEKKKLTSGPYVIGLTGGVASGKSGVARWLTECGAEIINCDLLGHEVYQKGKPCHTELVQHFGSEILTPDGEVDRRVLGSIVFKNPEELKKLNSIVWPWIESEVKKLIENSEKTVVVVEAAVLLAAKWDKNCHEVWTTLVPPEEAVKRLVDRNKLTEEQALARIKSQASNKENVQSANVVFCTLWDVEVTRAQVKKAWNLLQGRLL